MYIEQHLIAGTEIHKNDQRKLKYLYFQLGLISSVPECIGGARRERLKKKLSNQGVDKLPHLSTVPVDNPVDN